MSGETYFTYLQGNRMIELGESSVASADLSYDGTHLLVGENEVLTTGATISSMSFGASGNNTVTVGDAGVDGVKDLKIAGAAKYVYWHYDETLTKVELRFYDGTNDVLLQSWKYEAAANAHKTLSNAMADLSVEERKESSELRKSGSSKPVPARK